MNVPPQDDVNVQLRRACVVFVPLAVALLVLVASRGGRRDRVDAVAGVPATQRLSPQELPLHQGLRWVWPEADADAEVADPPGATRREVTP